MSRKTQRYLQKLRGKPVNFIMEHTEERERMEDYEKREAAITLITELEKGRVSGEKERWYTLEEIKGITTAE